MFINESNPRFQKMLQEFEKNEPGIIAQSSVDISLIPMHGGFLKTAEQQQADEKFRNEIIKVYGSKEEASDAFVVFARQFFEAGNLNMAMKRFNNAWLLNDENPDVFIGFGDIFKKRGHSKEAAEMYAVADDLKKKQEQLITQTEDL